MATVYASRARVFVQGTELLDCQSLTINLNLNVKPVSTMTSTGHANKGWIRGNKDITFTFEVAVQQTLGTPSLETLDVDSNDVAIQFIQGADKYLLKGCAITSMSQSASGVDAEGKKQFSGLALDLVSLTDGSALFPTSLTSLSS